MSDEDEVTEGLARGKVRFLGLDVLTAPGVLVARRETELLAETAVRRIAERARAEGKPPTVVDMCCGSGNLAGAIAIRVPEARVWACDLTRACVSLARRNMEALGVADRVTVVEGDLFAPLGAEAELLGRLDAVVSCPPYLSTGKLGKASAALLEREPREAFDAGPYGIAIHQRIIKDALPFLAPGGLLLFEIGVGQERQVTALFARTRGYEPIEAVADPSGEVRVLCGRKRRETA